MVSTRLKMVVNTVAEHGDQTTDKSCEEITMSAVYSDKPDSANKEWAKWTPTGQLKFTVTNPAVFGKFRPGQFVYVDLTHTDRDSR